jgi:hypothetical protein
MRKLITILGSCFILTLILSSCGGSEDAKENGEKAGKCDCEGYELEIEKYKLKEDQLDTYDDGEIDDREIYAEIQLDLFDIEVKQYDLQKEIQVYFHQQYAGENFHDDDDHEEWIEDFEESREDYVDDNCEDEKDDAEDAGEDYYEAREKSRDY